MVTPLRGRRMVSDGLWPNPLDQFFLACGARFRPPHFR